MIISAKCEKCPLASQKGLVVKDGPEQCDIVFVSDGPSSAEVFGGHPLIGPQGTLFDKVLEYNNIRREDVFVTYACLCRLNAKNYKKGYQKDEINHCHERLVTEITSRKPKIVVALGNIAIQAVLNRKDGVTSLRGTPIWSYDLNTWVLVTYNPGALMRSPKSFSDFESDIGKIRSAMCGDAEALKKDLETTHWVARDPYMAIKAIEFLKKQKKVSCDIETQGFGFRNDKIYCISFCWAKGKACVLPGYLLDDPFVRFEIKHLMECPHVTFVWQNGKFDIKFFIYQYGIHARVDEDIMLKHYSIDERRGTHDLEQLSQTLLGAPDFKSQFWKKWKSQIANLPEEALEELYAYNASDSDYTFRIDDKLQPRLESDGAKRAYKDLLVPGSNTFAEIEGFGFYIDQEKLQEAEDKYEMICNGLRERINEAALEAGWDPALYKEVSGVKKAPNEFNVNSWRHLGFVLYDLLKLPLYKGTRTTEEDALVQLQSKVLGKPGEKYFEELYKPKDNAPEKEKVSMVAAGKAAYKEALDKWLTKGPAERFIFALLDYREKFKLYSTYVMGIKKALQDDGRVHATFLLHGTETGRLASKGPNMQNIPRLKEIRNLFSVAPGYKLLQTDYSQCELRVLAVLSNDPFLKQTYYNGEDLHDAVALKLFGEGFTKEQRVRAKAVNFGLAYGRTEYTIAEEYDIPVSEARQVIKDWFANITVAGQFILDRRQDPKRTGVTTTSAFDRKRRFPLITEDNAWNIENESINFIISSNAADLAFRSTILINEEFKRQKLDAHIINEVHDSIMVEVREDQVDDAARIMLDIMQTVPGKVLNTDMPFIADLELGTHWGALKKI